VKKLTWCVISVFAASLIAEALVLSQPVLANHSPGCFGFPQRSLGRCTFEGFFTHSDLSNPFQGTFVWHDGFNVVPGFTTDGTAAVTSAATFIARVRARLNIDLTGCNLNPVLLTQPDPCIERKRNAMGAAFFVNTMTGLQGPDMNGLADGINQAKSRFNLWAATINDYEANNRVEWNFFRQPVPGEIDWIGDSSGRDILFIDFTPTPELNVVFYNPDGTEYVIARRCANPKGEPTALVPPPPPPPSWQF
jgi:hypothetical protein